MTAALFLLFVAATAGVAIVLAARYLTRATAIRFAAGLTVWLAYVGAMSYYGVVSNPTLRPPGILYILLPVFLFVAFGVVRSAAGARVALSFPAWILTALPVYRVGVELFLHQLWREGLLPRMLTLEGGNADILVGLSAPLAGWFATRGRGGMQIALVWNWLGLLSLMNTAMRFAMTTPGPFNMIHTEIPNLAAGTYPYTFIPGFFAPLAVVLHILAIRGLRGRISSGTGIAVLLPHKQAI